MPEGPEVTILSQYLMSKIKNKLLISINILGGKYKRTGLNNIDNIQNKNYKIQAVKSKGKLMWFELENNMVITSHLGLAGFWSFSENKSDRLKITIRREKNKEKDSKDYTLCYQDPRNFGNIEIMTKSDLDKKLATLADDALKTSFTNKEFEDKIQNFLLVSKTRKDQLIFLVLMEQNEKKGLLSGLGNYLVPEILYDCKISPKRIIGNLTVSEIHKLAESIRKLVKLSYYSNSTGYMTNFEEFIKKHKIGINNGKYPDYHPNVKLTKTDNFEFKVYQQKFDPLGNPVEANKDINKGRTTYWVPNIQI